MKSTLIVGGKKTRAGITIITTTSDCKILGIGISRFLCVIKLYTLSSSNNISYASIPSLLRTRKHCPFVHDHSKHFEFYHPTPYSGKTYQESANRLHNTTYNLESCFHKYTTILHKSRKSYN